MTGRQNVRFGGGGRGFNASSLLEKASAQLRGEKSTRQSRQDLDDEDEDLDAYFSAMKRKSSTKTKGFVEDLSDSESIDMKPASKPIASKFLKKPKTVSTPKAHEASSLKQGTPKSTALNKASSFSLKNKPTQIDVSDSDMDLSLSMDEHIVADVQAMKGSRAGPANSSKGMFSTLPSAERFAAKPIMDTDEESLAEFIGDLSSSNASTPGRTPVKTQFLKSVAPKQVEKTKESPMTALIPPAQPKGILKTPRTPRSSTMDYISEEDDQPSIIDESVSVAESSDGSFKVQLFDLDSLEPANPQQSRQKKPKADSKKKAPDSQTTSKSVKKTAEPDNFFSNMGLQTVEDLLGNEYDKEASYNDYDLQSGHSSEIRTEMMSDNYESDFEPTTGRSIKSAAPLRSILSPSPRPTPRSSRSRVRYSLDEVQEVSFRSPSPETIHTRQTSIISDYDESIKTETDSANEYTPYSERSASEKRSAYSRGMTSEDYSDDFNSASDSQFSSRRYSRTLSTDSNASYSDDLSSYTDQTSERSRSPSPVFKQKRSTRTREIQTGLDIGLQYSWDPTALAAASLPQYGLGMVDPTPIATHVVSPDALETLTAYSPAVLALNDMLRQQLQLTTQFVHIQNSHHARLTSALDAIHDTKSSSYTTINDYKQYVKKHKKPVISFDEALKQVKREMELV